jgi:TPR repeat protein
MRGSRMRPVVKVEDGVGGAVADEGLQPEADAGRPWQRRRLSEAGAAVSDEALSRRAYLEAQALAVEGMERTRVLGEELLQAKALIAKLEAEARIKDVIIQSKDGIIQSKDEQLKADIRFKDELLQAKDVIIQSKDDQLRSKDDQLHAKDAQLRLHPAGMAPFNADSAAVGAAQQPAHAQPGGGVAAAAEAADSVFQEGQRLYGEQWYSDAARWGQAALSKHAASHAFLSDMLIDGRPGVAKDEKRAFELAKAGAALGCAHSKGALGRCYLVGEGVAANVGKGLALGRESEAAGSCFGQYVVGVWYNNGQGVAQDDAEAVRLYRLAAAQGHAQAQCNLGVMFDIGEGVAQDDAEAVRLYRLTAAQGHAQAQFYLDIAEAIRG